MATSDGARVRRERIAAWVLGALALVAVGALAYRALARPPQMGTSADAFHTVDALYTAVRSRDARRVGECETRLHVHRDAGKLPPRAAEALDAIARTARAGDWDAAAERLYDFMLAQRREGVIEPEAPRAPKAKAGRAKQ